MSRRFFQSWSAASATTSSRILLSARTVRNLFVEIASTIGSNKTLTLAHTAVRSHNLTELTGWHGTCCANWHSSVVIMRKGAKKSFHMKSCLPTRINARPSSSGAPHVHTWVWLHPRNRKLTIVCSICRHSCKRHNRRTFIWNRCTSPREQAALDPTMASPFRRSCFTLQSLINMHSTILKGWSGRVSKSTTRKSVKARS